MAKIVNREESQHSFEALLSGFDETPEEKAAREAALNNKNVDED